MIRRIFLLSLAAALLAVPAVFAQSAAELRQRMAQRLAQVDELKAQGAVGENNRGLLEVREGGAAAAAVVSAENRDREAVYALIARDTGSTPEAVARARARQIAQQARPGVWVQDERGDWSRR